MAVLVAAPPCVIYEDEEILVANKPGGLNTHSPSPYAGEGLYDWLRHREPRWADLAIMHRLDKATSGLIVFAKTKLANKSLTEQFTRREVHKRYRLLVAKPLREKSFTVRGGIRRVGDKYESSPQGEPAETRFQYVGTRGQFHLLAAEPLTGRTHQIRVHCAEKGLPIVGDALYGGEEFPRVCLHAAELAFRHPQTGMEVEFSVEPDFFTDPAIQLRRAVIAPDTNAYRLLHGRSDSADYYLERWDEYLLVSSAERLQADERIARIPARGVYGKLLTREVAKTSTKDAAAFLISGEPAPSAFPIVENGVKYEISFERGYSAGLFLDQRENRRRLLRNHVAAGFPIIPEGTLAGKQVLNTFAYTCGFSVCAALAGAETTSLDLSRKYLDWGQRNFQLNSLNPSDHDFIFGDVFEWAQRFRRKGRVFDVVVLDPPTFSRGKLGSFQAEKNYGDLVGSVLPLLSPNGVLFASTNAHKLSPEKFVAQVRESVTATGRTIAQEHFVPQPIDFPIGKEEGAYLKTLWLRVR